VRLGQKWPRRDGSPPWCDEPHRVAARPQRVTLAPCHHGRYTKWADENALAPNAFDHAPSGAEVAAALFATEPIEWNRLPHFQDVTVRLIAQNGILRGTEELYLQGEAATGKVALAPPLGGASAFHLFCSAFNAGATELAAELAMADVWLTKGKKAGGVKLAHTADASKLAACDHMLVLLDERTWTSGDDTAQLVEHIHQAMRLGVHINCVHEFPAVVGPPRHECEFGLMFGDDWTPAHLTGGKMNLYKEIALALKGAAWRQPGLVAFATKLVASAAPHKPVDVTVPDSYEPATGPNPWKDAAFGGAAALDEAAAPTALFSPAKPNLNA